jgi:signal transduction histidine kinase
MTGVEFLSRVREIDPESVRVVLTGCTDLLSAEAAINQGEVWRFVTKPWDDVDLRQTVAAASERYRVAAENRVMLDKLAAIGLLAGGVAHELAGPLTRILALTNLVASEAPAGSSLSTDLAQIESATMHAKTIVGELLDFARTSPTLDRRPVLLGQIAEKSISLSRFQLHGIDVRTDLHDAAPVLGDPNRLEQVVLNLLTNAIDAVAASRREGRAAGRVLVETWLEGTHAKLAVQDDGTGIAEEAKPRLFDAFYTTKEAGKGTGLGLPVSLGIIREHGGTMEVHSTPGQGARFVLSVPALSS